MTGQNVPQGIRSTSLPGKHDDEARVIDQAADDAGSGGLFLIPRKAV
jgi:hypothetical protein